ncbi:flavodoxin family protein [Leifsonia shinshuensis]|uniref:Flavodoxin-like domain-containing protein n=1 Tax=Leifsonia shinshuensis TaxID=150026 RepID=A0A853CWG2_9MICO|nr:flavodoxin domain-containing protein [Leifsonia shinshuensis]NYJ22915.1 hypothetical protein [Leifsonia shinshuensis]
MNDTAPAARAAIVYESMFGSTRQVAEAIAEGLRPFAAVTIVKVKDAPEAFPDADLLLVGAPTHVHSLSRPSTRVEAAKWGDDPPAAPQAELPGRQGERAGGRSARGGQGVGPHDRRGPALLGRRLTRAQDRLGTGPTRLRTRG